MKVSYDIFCCVLLTRLYYEKPAGPIVIFHIGGFDGSWDTFIEDSMPGVPLEIFSFEPQPYNRAVMEKMFRDRPNLHALPYAIGARNEMRTLYGTISTPSQNVSTIPGVDTIQNTMEVPTVTMDTACRKYGIEKVDLLRLNCEGAELEILEEFSSNPACVQRTNIIEVCMHGKALVLRRNDVVLRKQSVTRALEACGFVLVRGCPFGHKAIVKPPSDHLWQVFMKRDLLGEVL